MVDPQSLEGSRGQHPARELRNLGRSSDRRLSQSFLCEPAIAEAMVRAADLRPTDTVLEIGPGLGILTRPLLQNAGHVVCIELDSVLANELPRALGSPSNLEVVHDDALKVDLARYLDEPYVAVGSLPYHVATPILFKLAFEHPRPTRIVAMLQQEVAERLAAHRTTNTFLSIAFGLVATARVLRRVSPGAFFPVPKVRSAVVELDLRREPLVPESDLAALVTFLHAGYAQPRQQLHNSLARGLGVLPTEARRIIQSAGIDSTLRPGALGIGEWLALYTAYRGAQ